MLKYILILIAYLLGSIPFSFIFGEIFRHKDIRSLGSGNVGATNSFRVFGKIIGTSVLLLDTFKGGLIVFLIKYTNLFGDVSLFPSLIYGFIAVIGHVFPVWLKFKGGKGVATSFGLLLAYSPLFALLLIPLFFTLEVVTRYVSMASCFTTLTTFYIGLMLYIYGKNNSFDLTFVIVLLFTTILIFSRHRSNFERIRNGTESEIIDSHKWDKFFNFDIKKK